MALQSSPPISLNDIKAEFGATGTRSLTEFYRGGAFVPNSPQNSNIPTSGAISLLDFLGASNSLPIGNLTDVTVRNGTLAPTGATSTYSVRNIGDVLAPGTSSVIPNVLPETWLVAGSASDFDVRFTVQGTSNNTTVTGTFGSWLSLGTTRPVALSANSTTNQFIGFQYYADILVEFRNSGVIVGSVDVRLEARRD